MKQCSSCTIVKPEESFTKAKSKKDGLASQCKICKRTSFQRWYQKNKQAHKINVQRVNQKRRRENRRNVLTYLQSHACVDCGESDPVVLEFDHRRDKSLAVSEMTDYSWTRILQEIAKCEIRCANCHRRKTAKERSWYRTVLPS